jgi:predicted aconitase
MQLESIDQDLLDGAAGKAAARAMAILVQYGKVLGAERFVPIQSAHIDACLYHGPSSTDFARRFVELEGRVSVPTTLNVGAVDVVHPQWHCGAPELIEQQRELNALYVRLGCIPTLTCAPYQRQVRPRAGEHIAWAESNAIVFANSVLGARTDRYGDFTDLCAALTGRVPLTGLHCDANRVPTVALRAPRLEKTGLPRDLYFAAVGYVTGRVSAGQVPLIRDLPIDSTEDELKALGAAGASSGSLALFHAEGITPESALATEHAAQRQLPDVCVTPDDLTRAIDRLCQVKDGEAVAAVCLGTPHYSIEEFRRLSDALIGRRRAAAVEMYVSTSREIAATVDSDARFEPIRSFGVRVVVDTCTYVAPVVRGTGAILTTSAKYAHYAPGNIQRRTALMTLERCLRSAELGAVAPPC